MEGGALTSSTFTWRNFPNKHRSMSRNKVSSLLLISKNHENLTQAFLFQVARHFSYNGSRVLYIAPKPISALPPSVNNHEVILDPEIMRLITFVYLSTSEELINYICTMDRIHKPPTAIILQNMEQYCNDDNASLISALLTDAATTFGIRLERETALVVSYMMPVPYRLMRNFFLNVWHIRTDKSRQIMLENLNPSRDGSPSIFHFILEDPSQLILKKILKVEN